MSKSSRIIAVVNQKGGVGKTTTAINVAASLASLGNTVLLIDIDAQGNATSGLGVQIPSDQPSLYDVLMDQASLEDAVIKTSLHNLFAAPASVDLAGAAVDLVNQSEREFRLDKAIQALPSLYDYIIIDCPPSLGLLTLNGIVAAREVLVPVQAEYYALEGLAQLLQTIQLIQERLQPQLRILGAVLTMFDKRNRLSQAVFSDVYQHIPYTVFRSVIPRNVRLAEAPSYGKSIIQYARTSKGARAYLKLARELIITSPGTRNVAAQQPSPAPAPPPPPPVTNSSLT